MLTSRTDPVNKFLLSYKLWVNLTSISAPSIGIQIRMRLACKHCVKIYRKFWVRNNWKILCWPVILICPVSIGKTMKFHHRPSTGAMSIKWLLTCVMAFSWNKMWKSQPEAETFLTYFLCLALTWLVNSVHVKPGISDHDSVVTEIALRARVSKNKPWTVFMYDKADQGILAAKIATLKDEILTEGSERDANSYWQIFTRGLQKIMENCIPQKVIKGRYNLPWLDHSLRKKIRKKNKYHRLAKRAKTSAALACLSAIASHSKKWDTHCAWPVHKLSFRGWFRQAIETTLAIH